jgi:hypothetical protein
MHASSSQLISSAAARSHRGRSASRVQWHHQRLKSSDFCLEFGDYFLAHLQLTIEPRLVMFLDGEELITPRIATQPATHHWCTTLGLALGPSLPRQSPRAAGQPKEVARDWVPWERG